MSSRYYLKIRENREDWRPKEMSDLENLNGYEIVHSDEDRMVLMSEKDETVKRVVVTGNPSMIESGLKVEYSWHEGFSESQNEDIQELKEKLQKYQEEINELEKQNMDLIDELDDLKFDKKSLEQNLAGEERINYQHQEEIKRLKKELEELRSPESSEPDESAEYSSKEECPYCGELYDPRGLAKHKSSCGVKNEEESEDSSIDYTGEKFSRKDWKSLDLDQRVEELQEEFGSGEFGVSEACSELIFENVQTNDPVYMAVYEAITETDSFERVGRGKYQALEDDSGSSDSQQSTTDSSNSESADEEAENSEESSKEPSIEEEGSDEPNFLKEDSEKLAGSQKEYESLNEYQDQSQEEKRKYLLRVVDQHQPVTVEGMARKMFGDDSFLSSELTGCVRSDLEHLCEEKELSREVEDGKTMYWMSLQVAELREGAYRLKDIDSTKINGKSLICTECGSQKGVFDSTVDAKKHKRDIGHDSWILSTIPVRQWRNEETIEKIIEKKTGPMEVEA